MFHPRRRAIFTNVQGSQPLRSGSYRTVLQFSLQCVDLIRLHYFNELIIAVPGCCGLLIKISYKMSTLAPLWQSSRCSLQLSEKKLSSPLMRNFPFQRHSETLPDCHINNPPLIICVKNLAPLLSEKKKKSVTREKKVPEKNTLIFGAVGLVPTVSAETERTSLIREAL